MVDEKYLDYYRIALAEYFDGKDGGGYKSASAINFIRRQFIGQPSGMEFGAVAIDQVLRELGSLGYIDFVEDEFAGNYIVLDAAAIEAAVEHLRNSSSRYKIYKRLGELSYAWLSDALRNVERALAREATNFKDGEIDRAPIDVDIWEPLTLDLNDPQVPQVIDDLEKAINSIRADNGFAATHAADRDNLIAHADATLASAKEGKVARGQILQNFVSAGRWLSEKFLGSALAVSAGELVKAGLRLLGLLS